VVAFCAVTYRVVFVLFPKSKIRLPFATVFKFTHARAVKLLNPPATPVGRLTYCEAVADKVSCPLPEKLPPLGRVPCHTGPPTESAVFVPPASLKL
jgi:hypothetical protein